MALPVRAPAPAKHTLRRFRFNGPNRIAGLMLLFLLAQGLWVLAHRTLTAEDFRVAQCGRETWERPSPIAGYYTSCGNLHDGVLAYRLAGLPLTLARLALGDRASSSSTTWEMAHEISTIPLLVGLPFLAAGLALGACLWWVARRLFGNRAGYLALGLYCSLPPAVEFSTRPNPEILAAFGVFALLYTGMGVAHAMQGPRRRWRPRLVLITVVLGVTAASHLLAAALGLLLAAGLMLYLMEDHRALLPSLVLGWAAGAGLFLLLCYGFHFEAASYLLRGGAGLFGFSPEAPRALLRDGHNAPLSLLLAAAVAVWATLRRARYFGNTVPLVLGLLFAFLVTTQVASYPLLWALPFLLLFVAGVFADGWESTRFGEQLAAVTGLVVAAQAALCLAALPALAR
jgi:hypothetical protein